MAPFGVDVVVDYPKCPQDLNAIENAWNVLCHWWDVTVPARLESREDCVNRLQAAVLKGLTHTGRNKPVITITAHSVIRVIRPVIRCKKWVIRVIHI